MPDDRLLHPRLGHSAKVVNLTDLEARVWGMGYMLAADDCGVMRRSAVALQNSNEALARRPAKVIEKALERLIEVGLLMPFEHQGFQYVCQWDWQDWQHVRHPRASVNPTPPPEILAKCSEATRELFAMRLQRSGKVSEILPTVEASRSVANGLRLTATGNGTAGKVAKATAVAGGEARSRRPMFTGQRFVVFEWQVSDLERLLGPKEAEAFDLHAFFFDLDARAAASGQVIPQRDGGAWLQTQVMAEAQRRGLRVEASAPPKPGPRSTVPNAEATRRHLDLRGEG